MTKYSKEVEEEIKKIDELIEKSRQEDIFQLSRQKLRELNARDHTLTALILVFKSKSLGQIEVPVTIDY